MNTDINKYIYKQIVALSNAGESAGLCWIGTESCWTRTILSTDDIDHPQRSPLHVLLVNTIQARSVRKPSVQKPRAGNRRRAGSRHRVGSR